MNSCKNVGIIEVQGLLLSRDQCLEDHGRKPPLSTSTPKTVGQKSKKTFEYTNQMMNPILFGRVFVPSRERTHSHSYQEQSNALGGKTLYISNSILSSLPCVKAYCYHHHHRTRYRDSKSQRKKTFPIYVE